MVKPMSESQVIIAENKAFSKFVPMLQLAWDSTSLGALKTCPRYYLYNIIYGYSTKAENVHLVFGSYLHSAVEHYYHCRANGFDHKTAVESTTLAMLEVTFDKVLKRPWFSDEPTKNRMSLIRAVVWYLDKHEHDNMTTVILKNGKPAVELSFRHETGLTTDLTDEEYLLCGHLDRVVEWNDSVYGMDHKTTKSAIYDDFFQKFSPDNQISLYMLSGQVVLDIPMKGFIIDGIQVGATFARFQRGVVTRTKNQLNEWFKDLQFWLRQAETFAEQEHYPMNEKSCSNYGGCPYRQVCGASPEARPQLLQHLYHRRIWDPLTTR